MPSQESIPEQPVFGRRLRALRVARGMSQSELAGTEISAAYLSRLESGARPPTPRVLSYLCGRLEVSPSVFRASVGSPLAQALATVATIGETPQTALHLESALEREGDGDASLRWQALWLLARCYQAEGRADEELRVLKELVSLGGEIGQVDMQARARVRLARRYRASGDLSEARAVAGEAHALATENGLPHRDVIEALLTLISIEAESGRLTEARGRVDRLVEALSADVPARLQVEALWTAAGVAVRQGDRAATAELLGRALGCMPSNEDPVLWLRLRLAAASMYLQMDPRDIGEARRRLLEAASAVDLVGMPLHHRELLILQCQLAFHEGRFDEAVTLSARLGEDPEGVGGQDRVRLEILRNQLAIIAEGRAGAVVAMERLAKEARESGNVELSSEIWRALAESLAHVNGVTA
ncbi:helix-turn-helix domain-containing protein [Streptomyces sp. NBC_01343]|uniref:helix-turn-helix domain-containing protein n=1 Tax=Streptomyces sp. NBC_01343 TaxID=2903832 RepID=UPI002E0FCCF4|nr:helix-turn-helix domain-containing protein [Streptomyces sp. NBC_01343]